MTLTDQELKKTIEQHEMASFRRIYSEKGFHVRKKQPNGRWKRTDSWLFSYMHEAVEHLYLIVPDGEEETVQLAVFDGWNFCFWTLQKNKRGDHRYLVLPEHEHQPPLDEHGFVTEQWAKEALEST